MTLISIMLTVIFGISLVFFFIFIVRLQQACPFCRTQVIDIVNLRGTVQGTILKELGVSNRSFPETGRLFVCEQCRIVFDCRQVKNGRVTGLDALTINDFRCRNCNHVMIEGSDPSLTRKECHFLATKLRGIEMDLPDGPTYFCRECGCVNVWQQNWNSGYYILTARTDLGLYPEAESVLRQRRRANALEEISLIRAVWSFEPDCISATPPSLTKDLLGMCDFFGEFKILRHERKIICGKRKKRREWPLDDSWQVDIKGNDDLFESPSPHQESLVNRQEPGDRRVRLFSRKYKIAFFLHRGGKFTCQHIEEEVKRSLDLTAIAPE